LQRNEPDLISVNQSAMKRNEETCFLKRLGLQMGLHSGYGCFNGPGKKSFGRPHARNLIRWYIDSFQPISKWQRSKQSQLLFLEKHPIGDVDAVFLESGTLVDHVRSRRAKGAGPMTVANDLRWIGVVLRAAKSVKGMPVHPEIVEEARNACRELRLIGKSRRRERRPTTTELTKLDEYFARRDGRSGVPMRDIMWFAVHSARREAEICRLEWADNDRRGRTGLVRDAKHPRHKEGNHRRFKFTAEAWQIIERQPKTGEYIFPWDAIRERWLSLGWSSWLAHEVAEALYGIDGEGGPYSDV
jgi:integrase